MKTPALALALAAALGGPAHAAGAIDAAALPEAAATQSGAQSAELVLTLDEAARLLRSPAAAVAALAEAGDLPARRIGGEWRFSRSALEAWLARAGHAALDAPHASLAPHSPLASDDAPPPAADPLAASQLAALRGRGSEGEAPVVGEQPSAASADAVAARDQGVLLKGGQATLELGLSYARAEAVLPGFTRVEANRATASLTGRYGLADNLQISATLPYTRERSAVYGTAGANSVTSESATGDASLALFGVALRETAARPAVILNLQGVVPTGPGDSAIGGGVSLTRNHDPLLLFASLSYLYGIDHDVNDPDRSLARHNVSFSVGYAYALNESIALSAQFSGGYRTHEVPLTDVAPPRERYQLQLGLTYLLTPSLYVEPTIAFGLASGVPDFTFGLAIPYAF